MTEQQAMRMALEALESSRVFVTTKEKIKHPEGTEWYDKAITALRQALAEHDSRTLYREGYVNGYAFGEAAGKKQALEQQAMPSLEKAARMALEYVESVPDDRYNADHIDRDALITALRQALEQQDGDCQQCGGKGCVACDARKQQLADEPVAWMNAGHLHEIQQARLPYAYMYPKEGAGAHVPLYTRPQPAAWVGLMDEEMKRTCYEACSYDPYTIARAIEAKLKEKNT